MRQTRAQLHNVRKGTDVGKGTRARKNNVSGALAKQVTQEGLAVSISVPAAERVRTGDSATRKGQRATKKTTRDYEHGASRPRLFTDNIQRMNRRP